MAEGRMREVRREAQLAVCGSLVVLLARSELDAIRRQGSAWPCVPERRAHAWALSLCAEGVAESEELAAGVVRRSPNAVMRGAAPGSDKSRYQRSAARTAGTAQTAAPITTSTAASASAEVFIGGKCAWICVEGPHGHSAATRLDGRWRRFRQRRPRRVPSTALE